MNIYEQDLGKTAANHVPLSPVSFVERSAEVFGDLESVVHGRRRYRWQETRDRSAQEPARSDAYRTRVTVWAASRRAVVLGAANNLRPPE